MKNRGNTPLIPPTPKQLTYIPEGKTASAPQWHPGGAMPVPADMPVSIWFGPYPGMIDRKGWWVAAHRADSVDWSQPWLYRTRKGTIRAEATTYRRERVISIAKQLRKYADELETLI